MDELFSDALGPLFRTIFRIGRFLIWELLFEYVGWTTGWLFWRAVTLGRFPAAGWRGYEQADFAVALTVELTGIGLLAALGLWAYL